MPLLTQTLLCASYQEKIGFYQEKIAAVETAIEAQAASYDDLLHRTSKAMQEMTDTFAAQVCQQHCNIVGRALY